MNEGTDAATLACIEAFVAAGRSFTQACGWVGAHPRRLGRLVAERTGTDLRSRARALREANARVLRDHDEAKAAATADAAVRSSTPLRAAIFVPAAQPFAHDALINFLAMRCMPAVESIVGPEACPGYRRAWRGSGGRGTAVLRPVPAGVLLQIEGTGRVPLADLLIRTRRLFDPDAPVDEIRDRLGTDPLLAASVGAAPGRRVPGNWDPFELAVRAVLGQQVSVVAARTHANRLLDLLGVQGPDGLFPSADALAEADLSGLAMPGARRAALGTLARAVAQGDVDLAAPAETVRASLLALRGIGPWTADYIAMRGLKERDAFPAGDLVVRQALAVDGRLPSEAQVRARAEAWRPVRAYAALHLWASVGAGG